MKWYVLFFLLGAAIGIAIDSSAFFIGKYIRL